jgi:hypothetical protein
MASFEEELSGIKFYKKSVTFELIKYFISMVFTMSNDKIFYYILLSSKIKFYFNLSIFSLLSLTFFIKF